MPQTPPAPHSKSMLQRLERSISLGEAVVYGLGIILGAGVYALIGEAAGIAGNAMWLSFALAAAVASLTGLSYCELSSLFPQSAAEYTYVKKASGSNFLGFMMGWIALFAAMVAISTVSLGFAGYFSQVFGTPVHLTAISLIAVLSIVNFLGVRESTLLNLALTLVAVLGLVFVILIGLPSLGSVDYFSVAGGSLSSPAALNSIATAAALIFFAYIGFEDIANVSEETIDAKSTVPKAILLALVISTVLYVLVALSAVSVVPWEALAESQAPIALVAGTAFGPAAYSLFSVIALFATASTVLIILVAVSRMLYGISADHSLPPLLSRIHSKTRTPFVSIAITSLLAMLFVLYGSLKDVAFITNFGVFIMFFLVNISVIVLRFTKPLEKRRFTVPLNIGSFPLVPALGAFSVLYLLLLIEPSSALFAASALLFGIPLYLFLKP